MTEQTGEATPPDVLRERLHNSLWAKTELEHFAKRELDAQAREIAEMKEQLAAKEQAIVSFRKMERRDYMVCGRCGRDYHTLNLNDCPFCEGQALGQKGGE